MHTRNKANTVLTAMVAAALAGHVPAHAQSIRMVETYAAGVPVKAIFVDLKDLNVKVTAELARYGAGHAEPFAQMVRRAEPTVAVTGTFFSTRNHVPIGDIVIDGELAHFGGVGTALCITDNNEVEFLQPKRYTHQDWSRFDFVLRSGPRLIHDGLVYVDPRPEGFHDQRMLTHNSRLAVGVTRSNVLVFVATRKPVYLSRLARAMRALGAINAINLDAGSSLGLYYKGKMLIRPRRWLTNVILVYANRWNYEERRTLLAASRTRSARVYR
ncbi:MAG: phosphodiester glycosidase family protein [Chthonomonadales bacterium]